MSHVTFAWSGAGWSPLVVVPPLHTPVDEAVDGDTEIARLSPEALIAGIARLRVERDAVILAHNYQVPAIQDLADFVGDSLELAQQAATTTAARLVVCGVHFIAETASIVNPGRRVLIPDPRAGCSLAQSVFAADVRAWRSQHPGAVVVAYMNTDAEVKAEADYCCTSANAVQVVDAIPAGTEILFLPDRHLGRFVEQRTGRRLHLWPGECHVHAAIGRGEVQRLAALHPDADLLLHSECGGVADMAGGAADGGSGDLRAVVVGTGGMVRHASGCHKGTDLVGTEIGMLHRLARENASTRFVPVRDDAVCSYMKAITPAKLYRSLRDDLYEVWVPPPIATRARAAINRMLALS